MSRVFDVPATSAAVTTGALFCTAERAHVVPCTARYICWLSAPDRIAWAPFTGEEITRERGRGHPRIGSAGRYCKLSFQILSSFKISNTKLLPLQCEASARTKIPLRVHQNTPFQAKIHFFSGEGPTPSQTPPPVPRFSPTLHHSPLTKPWELWFRSCVPPANSRQICAYGHSDPPRLLFLNCLFCL